MRSIRGLALPVLAVLAVSCGDSGPTSGTPTATASATATSTAPPGSDTATPTATGLPTGTASATAPHTATYTPTPTLGVPTGTATATTTATPTNTPTDRCGGKTGVAGTREVVIQSGGLERSFLLTVPDAALQGDPVPLVLVYHGHGATAEVIQAVTRFPEKAAERGFITAAGNGTGRSWNAGVCCDPAAAEHVDDVGFTRDMVAAIAGEYCIDPSRVYATGFSNGGAMVFRLACEASDLFAAFAPAGGSLALFPCAPEQPRPIQIINDVMDPIVPFALGEASFEEFLKHNACTDVRETTAPAPSTTCEIAPECADGAATELCAVEGVGHRWPGGATDPNGAFDATDAVWEFFSSGGRASRPNIVWIVADDMSFELGQVPPLPEGEGTLLAVRRRHSEMLLKHEVAHQHELEPSAQELVDDRLTPTDDAEEDDVRLEEANLLDRDVFVNGVPHEWFTYLREHRPLFRHPEPHGPGFWVVSKYADVQGVSRDPVTYSSDQDRGGVTPLEEPETPDSRSWSEDPARDGST